MNRNSLGIRRVFPFRLGEDLRKHLRFFQQTQNLWYVQGQPSWMRHFLDLYDSDERFCFGVEIPPDWEEELENAIQIGKSNPMILPFCQYHEENSK